MTVKVPSSWQTEDPKTRDNLRKVRQTLEQLAKQGGGTITRITSSDGSVDITDPAGPVVDLSASGGGGFGALSPGDLAALHWWKATSVTESGGLVDSLNDQGTSAKNFTQAGAARAPLATDGDGNTYLALDGVTDYYQAGVAADWKFLNDNLNAWTVAVVFQSTNPENAFLDTCNSQSANTGFGVYGNATFGYQMFVMGGTPGTFALAVTGNTRVTSKSVLVVRFHRAVAPSAAAGGNPSATIATLRRNAVQVCQGISTGTIGTYNNANPIGALSMGRNSTVASSFSPARIYEIVVDNKLWSDAQVLGYEEYARTTYNIPNIGGTGSGGGGGTGIIPGDGLTLVGDTLNVGPAADGSITVSADAIQVGVLATDAQHGVRGGGTGLHPDATGALSGFMPPASVTKLAGIAAGASANTTVAAPTNVTRAAAVIGVAVTSSPADHKHDIAVAAPSTLVVGGANVAGTSSSLVAADHLHALPAFGSAAGTFAQGNDSRLSDDRTASGLRTASTVVSVSAATAPTAGQVLTASSTTLAAWATPSAGFTQVGFSAAGTSAYSIPAGYTCVGAFLRPGAGGGFGGGGGGQGMGIGAAGGGGGSGGNAGYSAALQFASLNIPTGTALDITVGAGGTGGAGGAGGTTGGVGAAGAAGAQGGASGTGGESIIAGSGGAPVYVSTNIGSVAVATGRGQGGAGGNGAVPGTGGLSAPHPGSSIFMRWQGLVYNSASGLTHADSGAGGAGGNAAIGVAGGNSTNSSGMSFMPFGSAVAVGAGGPSQALVAGRGSGGGGGGGCSSENGDEFSSILGSIPAATAGQGGTGGTGGGSGVASGTAGSAGQNGLLGRGGGGGGGGGAGRASSAGAGGVGGDGGAGGNGSPGGVILLLARN